ncbi:hypothetical protein D049_5275B, partial [Vibrio parahaemolyticus VPTS-2010]
PFELFSKEMVNWSSGVSVSRTVKVATTVSVFTASSVILSTASTLMVGASFTGFIVTATFASSVN